MNFVKITCVLLMLFSFEGWGQVANVKSTTDIAFVHEGEQVVMVHKKARVVELMNRSNWKTICEWTFSEAPTGVAVRGDYLFVTSSYANGFVSRINLNTRQVEAKIKVGMGAISPVLTVDGSRLYICNQYSNTISEIDPLSMKILRTSKMEREPRALVLSKDEKQLYVANFLPSQRADLEVVASKVNVVAVKSFKTIAKIRLTNGSNALRDITLSPEGEYVFVSHNLGRFQVPTSQLQQGWMNTSGVSVIRTADHSLLGTFLVDQPEAGAAGVWGIQCDDKQMVVSQSGTHDISVIDYPALKKRLETVEDKEGLSYNLNFLNGIRKRFPIIGNGPRTLVMDGNEILIPTYFSDTLSIVKRDGLSVTAIAYNHNYKESIQQKGEKYFNDANYCFQGWQSCNGCHPGEARTDGMNWDLLNDGIGNPKNCKSMLFSHRTPPAMISGIRPDAMTAVRAGFVHIQFAQVSPDRAAAVDEYLKSLEPLPSPFLEDGELSEKAKRGKEVFRRAQCSSCHSGPLFTDMEMYRIGEVEFEKGWDTPTLREVWRTAPYLHDGRAADLYELFFENKHGLEQVRLKKREVEDLIEYVNSL